MVKIPLPWWTKTDWRHTKPLFVLCAIEFPITVACLALYGIADPDTYRTALWTEGSRNGWNSDPIELLYAAANYRPIPAPTPWNQFITDFNVVICVLSMFILLAKTVCYIIHIMPPFFSALLHACLVALWSVSVSHQLGSDYSDPAHPSRVPWMFTHGCGDPVTPALQGFCKQSLAALGVAAAQCLLFTCYMTYSIIMAFPSKQQKEEAARASDAEPPADSYTDKQWEYELARLPQTPGSPLFPNSPMTPRTLTFNTLSGTLNQKPTTTTTVTANRDLPLRHHISMGTETFANGEKLG